MRREGVRTYVVRTETLEEDLQGLFAWLCASPVATHNYWCIIVGNQNAYAKHKPR